MEAGVLNSTCLHFVLRSESNTNLKDLEFKDWTERFVTINIWSAICNAEEMPFDYGQYPLLISIKAPA
jgi:hypothetical protein